MSTESGLPAFGEDAFFGYHRLSRAYYADAIMKDRMDEIAFGVYHRDGGTSGEMVFREHFLGGKHCVRLESYADSWQVLGIIEGLMPALEMLAGDPTLDDIEKALIALHFEDCTAVHHD